MALYTFYTVKSTSPVAGIDIVEFDDDAAATTHAAALCEAGDTCVRMEVWQGERLIADRACSGGRLAGRSPPAAAQVTASLEFASARCPATGHMVQTHARLTASQIAALKTTVVYWCRLCACAHEARRSDLMPPAVGI